MFLCCTLFSLNVQAEKERKVLFIGIDGLRWIAITQTDAAPVLKALMGESLTYTNALAETPTWSSNGWAGLLTGTSTAKHGYYINEFEVDETNLATYVSFFQHVKHEYPDVRTASFVSWGHINDRIVRGSATENFEGDAEGGIAREVDLRTYAKAQEELKREDASLIFVQFDDCDSQGHNGAAGGFVLTNELYINALRGIDGYVKGLLEAVKARPTYMDEDWLVVVTTDHGGDKDGHGGYSYEMQNSFIILNNEAIEPALFNDTPTVVQRKEFYDVMALALGDNISAELPDMEALGFDVDGNFTIEMRVRVSKNGADPVILGNKNWTAGKNAGFCLAHSCYGNFAVRVNFGDGVGEAVNMDGSPLEENGDWVQVSLVVDRSNGKACLYEGGVQVASKDISHLGSFKTELPYRIGISSEGTSGGYFNGNLTELRVFNRALSSETVKEYAFKSVDGQHPNIDNLLLYNPATDGEGATFKGAMGKPDITFTVSENATLDWVKPGKQIFVKNETDYGTAPHLYDVAPTIFNFMGWPVRRGYQWDGKTLVLFNELPTDDELPEPADGVAVLDNFENGRTNYTFALNGMGTQSMEIVDNPEKNAVNGSEKVLKWTRGDNMSWAGFWADLNARAYELFDVDEYPYVSFKILRTTDGATARVKCERSGVGAGDVEIFPLNEPVKLNEWEELVFPLYDNGARGHYKRFSILSDYADGREPGTVVYMDDICMRKRKDNPVGLQGNRQDSETFLQVLTDGRKKQVVFRLEQSADVQLAIYDMAGQRIYNRSFGILNAGVQELAFPITGKGIYLLKLNIEGEVSVVKFVN